MRSRDWLAVRNTIGTAPCLTDEEIETVWTAIDKQVPEKVIRTLTPMGNIEQCPCCVRIQDWANDYCKYCGQALNWSKEEEE